jgi:hypothetical protein
MPGIFDRVIVLNLLANTAIFYVAARLYLLPLVPHVEPQQILVPILLLHSMRHLGMMFLTRGATYPGLPSQFANKAAFGDLVTSIIAFVAIPLVLSGSGLAKPAVWVFNVAGTVDLLVAYDRHDLQRAASNGAGLLDPGFLGADVARDALRDFCCSRTQLVKLRRCKFRLQV